MSAITIQPSDILTPEQLAANLKVTRAWVLDQLRPRNRRANPLPYFRVAVPPVFMARRDRFVGRSQSTPAKNPANRRRDCRNSPPFGERRKIKIGQSSK